MFFFFFRQISTFLLAIFDRICFNRSKGIVVLSLNSKDILPVIAFRKVIDLKFAISANLGQLMVACHVAEYPESRKVNSSQDSRKINLFPDSRKKKIRSRITEIFDLLTITPYPFLINRRGGGFVSRDNRGDKT